MRRLLHDLAARLILPNPPSGAGRVAEPGADDQLGRVAFKELAGPIDDLQVAPLIPDARHEAPLMDRPRDPRRPVFVDAERLLSEQGDAAFRDGQRRLDGGVRGQADEDGVQLGPVEHRPIVRIQARTGRLSQAAP